MHLIMRFPLGLLMIFSTLNPAFAQNDSEPKQKNYNSLLWEITGNGLPKPSYLYGTMHVSQKVAFHLTDTFFIALSKSNIVALEEDPGTWMEELSKSGILSGAEELYGYRFSNFYKMAFNIPVPQNQDITELLSFQPELLNGLLYRSFIQRADYEEDTYLDLFIYQSARRMGKPVVGLESFAEGQEYSLKAAEPDSDELKKTNYGDNDYSSREDIESAYRNGDLDLLDSLTKISYRSKNFHKYLIVERNKNFVAHMDSIMRTSASLFTGVGAAHLPGDSGIISMLRTLGYNVRPIAFKQSKKADKEKQRLENTFVSVNYTTHYLPDSTVSLMTPAKLYKLVGGTTSVYISPDMINGSYYCVFALNRMEAFTKQDINYTKQRIDSLLYEFIPGKILAKTYSTSAEGFPVVDITNKNRRGDIARLKIIISDSYIYFFEFSGTGDYVLNKQHDRFFKSIRLSNSRQSNDWKVIGGTSGGYSLEMPGKVYCDTKGENNTSTSFDDFIHSFNPEDSSFFIFIRNNFADFNYLEEDSFELIQLAYEFADQFDLTITQSEISSVDCGMSVKHPNLYATLTAEDSTSYFIRIVIDGPHYSLLCCKTGKSDLSKRFLDSFRLQPYQYAQGFEELSDTSMNFKVNTLPENENLLATTMKKLKYSNRSYYGDNLRYSSNKIKSRMFKSPETNEYISVSYKKYTPFFSSKKVENIWKTELKAANPDSSMLCLNKILSESDSIKTMSFLLADTGCSRGINYKLILYKDELFTLCNVIDTLTGPSLWAKTFYESFTPVNTDTFDIFSSKANLFLEYLYDTDSAKNKIAWKNVYNVSLDSSWVPKLIDWVNDTISKNCPPYFMEGLLTRIGRLKHQRSVPFLKEYYLRSEDSIKIQMTILEALADRKTLEATLAFKDLILADAPLTSMSFQISSMFKQYFDTLELASKLFPEILKLTSYPEYKEKIYELFAAVKTYRLLKVDAYTAYIPQILRDANDELKREQHTEESKSRNSNKSLLNSDYDSYDDDDDDDDADDNYAYNYNFSNEFSNYNSNFSFSDEKKYSKYRHKTETEDYAILLVDFYNTDTGVKNYFTKLQKLRNKKIVMKSYVLMLENSIPVPDSIWTNFASTREFRANLYSELLNYNKLDKFDTAYKSQMDMIESLLFGSDDKDIDSIVFLEKRYVTSRYDSGYVYFFKYKKEKARKWKLAYSYFQPANESDIEIKAKCKFLWLSDQDKVDKKIDKMCRNITLLGRKRTGNSGYMGY